MPNIFLGIIYKLVWGSRVVLDIDEEELRCSNADSPIQLHNYIFENNASPSTNNLFSKVWTQVAVSLATEFDAVTVADSNLMIQYGGILVKKTARNLPYLQKNYTSSGITQSLRFLLSSLNECEQLKKLDVYSTDEYYDGITRTTIYSEQKKMIKENYHALKSKLRSKLDKYIAKPPLILQQKKQPVVPPIDINKLTLCKDKPLLKLGGQVLGFINNTDHNPLSTLLANTPGLQSLLVFRQLHVSDFNSSLSKDIELQSSIATAPCSEHELASIDYPCNSSFTPFSQSDFMLSDIWFSNDFKLKVRIEREDSVQAAVCVMRCYQFNQRQNALHICSESQVEQDGITFLDIDLINPYYPLLFISTSEQGELFGITFLPFPSLCRGGMHFGELSSVGQRPEYLANLKYISNFLVSELIGSKDNKSKVKQTFAISRLTIDLRGAMGSEKIFSSPVKDWLVNIMKISAQPHDTGVELDETQTYLASALTEKTTFKERQSEEALTLTIAANSLPTVSALVTKKRIIDGGKTQQNGSYIVADFVTGAPKSIITMPSKGDDLLVLQSKHHPLSYPTIRRESLVDNASTVELQPQPPLAVSFPLAEKNNEASLLQPTAPDYSEPLLQVSLSDEEKNELSLSVLLCLEKPVDKTYGFFQSLSHQTIASVVHLVVVVTQWNNDELKELEAALNQLFENRYSVINSSAVNRSTQLNLAAKEAKGSHYLIVDETALLHDPRTLETLYLVASKGDDKEEIASVACVLLREISLKKGSEVRFHSGGIYISHLSFQSTPNVVFNEPYTLTAFPHATYPVIANSFRLILVNAKAWNKVGGLDTEHLLEHRYDLDFCLQTFNQGYKHLCTSLVTASSLSDGRIDEYLDSYGLDFMKPENWQKVISSVANIKEC